MPGSTDFPESMSASSDGTLYFSSFGNGRVWRAKPGEAQASEFIKTGSNGLASALGVLADDKSNTLYVCSDDFSAGGIKIPGASAGTSLKLFDLKSGEAKGSIPVPGQTTLCNDIVVAKDGNAYVLGFVRRSNSAAQAGRERIRDLGKRSALERPRQAPT